MVKAKKVNLIMNPGERAISFEKRRIPRYRLVQQIDCPQRVRVPAKARPNDIIGARIQLESDEITGWLLLNSQSLRGSHFGLRTVHPNRDRIARPRHACQSVCRSTAR